MPPLIDEKAMEVPAKRGITPEVHANLREQIKIASMPTVAVVPKPTVDPAERRANLVELYDWFAEWSEIARLVIKRRDYLILLGLAQGRRHEEEPPGGGGGGTPGNS